MKKIVIGCDHGAFMLKEKIKKHMTEKGYDVYDAGIHSEESADYPDIAKAACREYLAGNYSFGLLFCGTGTGISIAANKIPGIRCAPVFDLFTAEMSRVHNNANFLAFGGRNKYSVTVEEMIDRFSSAEFEGGRHERRVSKISDLEKNHSLPG